MSIEATMSEPGRWCSLIPGLGVKLSITSLPGPVCTENSIPVDYVTESPNVGPG
jgi:hypothetical protein